MKIKNFCTAISFLTILSFCIGCSFFATTFAPEKKAEISTTELAISAKTKFWETLHGGKYEEIPKVSSLLKAAYLENSKDPELAAYIGFLHIWRLSERSRLKQIPPEITDDAVLSRKYFGEAVSLDPSDARYLGFHGILMMTEGTIHDDQYLIRKGYYQGLEAINQWPQFNLFTVGYVLGGNPKGSKRFEEAVEMMWRNVEVCADKAVDRNDPNFESLLPLRSGEKRSLYLRACWNSQIAPYNFQGFFLNFGDLLVKQGNSVAALHAYSIAKQHSDFSNWPYKEVLLRRIEQMEENKERFLKDDPKQSEFNIMLRTPFSCMACHQEA